MTSLEVRLDPKATAVPTSVSEVSTNSAWQDGGRWDAWLARGRARDQRMLRRMGWVAGLIVVALVSWGLWSLTQ